MAETVEMTLIIVSAIAFAMSFAALVTAWCIILNLDEYEEDLSNHHMRLTMAETVIKRIEKRVMDE